MPRLDPTSPKKATPKKANPRKSTPGKPTPGKRERPAHAVPDTRAASADAPDGKPGTGGGAHQHPARPEHKPNAPGGPKGGGGASSGEVGSLGEVVAAVRSVADQLPRDSAAHALTTAEDATALFASVIEGSNDPMAHEALAYFQMTVERAREYQETLAAAHDAINAVADRIAGGQSGGSPSGGQPASRPGGPSGGKSSSGYPAATEATPTRPKPSAHGVPNTRAATADTPAEDDSGVQHQDEHPREPAPGKDVPETGKQEAGCSRGLFDFRSPNPNFAPNSAVVAAMGRQPINVHGVDCSEVAEDLHCAAGWNGRVARFEPRSGRTLKLGEDGGKDVVEYMYHEAYTDGRYAYDPFVSPTPVPWGDYLRALRGLNPGGIRSC